MAPLRLVLETTDACALCDQARAALARLAQELPITVEERRLPALRTGVTVPRVLLGGQVLAEGKVSHLRLKRALLDLLAPSAPVPGPESWAEPGALRGRRVALVGFGRSHRALARLLLAEGAHVTALDQSPPPPEDEEVAALRAEGLELRAGPDYLAPGLQGFDVVFLTPGMRKQRPEVEEARRAGAIITGEVPLFLLRCPCPVIGVTGSAGKTTTVTLLGEIARTAHPRVVVGGNIGRPLSADLPDLTADHLVVAELSSFQLELCTTSPQVGALLNLSPNHLDIHGSLEAYREAKLNIWRYQRPVDRSITWWDDPDLVAAQRRFAGRPAWFSARAPVPEGALVREGWLVVRDGERERRVLPAERLPLPGEHNLTNALAALAIAQAAGLDLAGAREVLERFSGVEHRLELCHADERGVLYYNDSIATAPDRTLAALRALPAPIVLIAGGSDKGLAYDVLGPAIQAKVRLLIVMGPTAAKIEAAVRRAPGPGPRIVHARDLEEAVAVARAQAQPGDRVLLSPASASYDQFRNFEERGRRFKELVRAPGR